MERARLNELGFSSRDEVMSFLRRLWRQERTECPICRSELELLHRKAKKSECDWQCRNCDKTYKTLCLLDEINQQMP